MPTTGGGHVPEPELDRLSNILKTFNDLFGDIAWDDRDRVGELITKTIPAQVAADVAFRNARENSDDANARIEHDKVLARIPTGMVKDDAELFKAVHGQRRRSSALGNAKGDRDRAEGRSWDEKVFRRRRRHFGVSSSTSGTCDGRRSREERPDLRLAGKKIITSTVQKFPFILDETIVRQFGAMAPGSLDGVEIRPQLAQSVGDGLAKPDSSRGSSRRRSRPGWCSSWPVNGCARRESAARCCA